MRLVFAGFSAELAVLGSRSWIGAERGEAGSITGADAHPDRTKPEAGDRVTVCQPPIGGSEDPLNERGAMMLAVTLIRPAVGHLKAGVISHVGGASVVVK